MTAVAVSVVVCGSALAALVLVLRHLDARDSRQAVRVTEKTEAELRELLKSAEMRLSKLEMARAVSR